MNSRNLKIIIRLFISPFLYLLRGLTYLVPRNKKIWLFGNGFNSFSDNSKYLFFYTIENCSKIRSIWISRNKQIVFHLNSRGFESYYKWSLKGIYYSLIGGIYFYSNELSDISLWLSGGAITVNLWHGTPIKKIKFDVIVYNTNDVLRKIRYIKPDYILSTSKKVSKIFSSAFRVPENHFLELGYPRNEILLKTKDEVLSFIDSYESEEIKSLVKKIELYDKAYVYMPTFRDKRSNFIDESNIDFNSLNSVLKQKNSLFIMKLHNNTKGLIDLGKYENILLISNNIDIYPLLPFTDSLITDYSSIYFDYKLMKKEVILFCFDKERYLSEDRDMYFNYDDIIKNELIASNFEELLNLINRDGNKSSFINSEFLEEMIFETYKIETNKLIVEYFNDKLNLTQ